MSPWIAGLKEYGVNLPETMERFLNDENFYLKCLKKMIAAPQFDQLGAALGIGNYEYAFQLTHTLKGMVGNMGLIPLQRAIQEMVEALRHQNYGQLDTIYQVIMNQYEIVCVLLADA